MAAPYAAAPQTTPAAIPTEEALTGEELSTLPPMGAPSFTDPVAEEEGELLVCEGDAPLMTLSERIGIAGLTQERIVLTLLSVLL